MMDIRPEFRSRDIRSYVIRSGRMTTGQKAAFERYWDWYGLELASGAVDFGSVFGRTAPLVLEIGFGMGDSLLEMCLTEPDRDFIGVEVYPPGVGKLMNRAADAGIQNLRVFLADAHDVLADCIPQASLARVQIYFPDPWHKKKHHKRRLIQREFVVQIHSRLTSGGILHLATDWENYAEHMMEVVELLHGYENLAGVGQFSAKPHWRPETKFERRGHTLDHSIYDLVFRKP